MHGHRRTHPPLDPHSDRHTLLIGRIISGSFLHFPLPGGHWASTLPASHLTWAHVLNGNVLHFLQPTARSPLYSSLSPTLPVGGLPFDPSIAESSIPTLLNCCQLPRHSTFSLRSSHLHHRLRHLRSTRSPSHVPREVGRGSMSSDPWRVDRRQLIAIPADQPPPEGAVYLYTFRYIYDPSTGTFVEERLHTASTITLSGVTSGTVSSTAATSGGPPVPDFLVRGSPSTDVSANSGCHYGLGSHDGPLDLTLRRGPSPGTFGGRR